MKWKNSTIGDIADIKKGGYITKKETKQGIYPVILGGQKPAYYIDKYNHTGKAIVISRSGASAGFVSFWNQPIFVTDGFLIEPKSNTNFEYLYYILKYKQNELTGMKRGSAIPHITPTLINNINISIPSIEIQHYIASILSAYDDLIENNQKQIKLLEEAAQRLYKEWFVDLRFPDYENTPVVDGVPEGWRIGRLDELGEFKRGKTITKDSVIVDNVPVVAGGLEPAYYHNTANTTAPVITISGSGNAGYVRMYYQKIWASDCSYIDTSKTDYIFFTYCFLKYNQNILYNLKKGSTILHVYAKDINAMKCLIPNEKIAIRFNKFVCPMFFKIGKLYKQIEELKEARDRLLPKLISGELEV